MVFNIDNYKGRYVMHCKTKEEAKSFCNYLHKHGREWSNGTSYANVINWDLYIKHTVYYFNEGKFANCEYAKYDGYTILEWSDFMNKSFTKADLKTGDIVKRRRGDIGIVGSETIALLSDGYAELDLYNEDLTYCGFKPNDIVAVRRPTKPIVDFDTFDECSCPIVYDREKDEPEELTLAEVCKLLGKNIKIIQ